MSFKSTLVFLLALSVILASDTFAQSKSAVQFYDTLGATKTGKVGWTGDATSGHIFIQTPNEGEVLKTQTGGIAVSGTVTATKFTGDGSSLTNLPAPSVPTVGSVAGLQDSLSKKANTTDISSIQTTISGKADTTWVNGKLNTKANASDVTTLQSQVGAKADSTSVNTKLTLKANSGDVTTLQTTVSTKVDSAWVAKKISASGAGSIVDGSVTTTKIADKAVTDAKIDSVSFGKIKGVPSFALTTSTSFDSLNIHGTVIQKNGNMGLGTANPDNVKLHVKSALGATSIARFTTNDYVNVTTGSGLDIFTGAPTGNTFSGINAYSAGFSALSNLVFQASGGNVGIGTTNPLGQLHIYNSNGTTLCIDAPTLQSSRLQFMDAGVTAAQLYRPLNTDDFRVNVGGGDRLTLLSNGNVGIGTTNPSDLLTLQGAGTASLNILTLKNETGNAIFELGKSAKDGILSILKDGNETIRLYSAGDSWFNSGKVGMGTPSPNRQLEVNNPINATIDGIRITNGVGNTSDGAELLYNNAGVTNVYLDSRYDAATAAMNFRMRTNGTPVYAMTILGSGNVSIPGNLCAGSTSCPSDRRYKTDITPIDSSLSKVSKLQGVYYNWDRAKWPKKNFPEGKQVGLIAQEVEMVVPEVVNTDKEGYKSLSYDKLTALLINATKELEIKNDSLRSENQILKANQVKILSRLDALEKSKK